MVVEWMMVDKGNDELRVTNYEWLDQDSDGVFQEAFECLEEC